MTIEMAETMPGPPEVVWRLITDWEHQDDWMLEASDFVVTSDIREGVGVEAEATITIAGIKTRDKVSVVGWEPQHRLAIRHLGWVAGVGEIFLTPLEGGRTYLFWREDLEPPLGIVGRVGLGLLKPLMRRIFVRDLRILASLTRAATSTALL
ncbi:MAG TPA: SRPBCC family protein [Actinomycetota bacterium]|nr:SRPBCC family protein [Actinomycetota bacterium]